MYFDRVAEGGEGAEMETADITGKNDDAEEEENEWAENEALSQWAQRNGGTSWM